MVSGAASIAAVSMRERVCREACRLVIEHTDVAVVLSDISLPYFQEAFGAVPKRIVNVGIMEQTMVGVGAGFAMEGFHPIVHTLTPFLVERPFEQLKIDFGYQRLGGTFISSGASFDYAVEGTTHHSPGDVALISTIPGFEILVPGTANEAIGLLRASFDNGQPTYVRLSQRENLRSYGVESGRIEVVRRSRCNGATVIVVGPLLSLTEAALDDLDVTLLYVTTVEPFDGETVRREAGERVIVVEPFLEGTLAHRVMVALERRPTILTSIGVPHTNLPGYGTREDLERVAGLDEDGIRRRIRAALVGGGSNAP
jgi:transketolase